MRRKITTIVGIMLLGMQQQTSQAQTTITSANTLPPVGYTDSIFVAAGISPGAAGNGVTWDFSAVPASYAGYFTIVDPATTPYTATFPTATNAMELHAEGVPAAMYDYYMVDNTGFYILASGYSAATPSNNYTPNSKLRIPFPFSYGNSATDIYEKVGDPPYPYTMTYDGFGTLKTPQGIYNDIIRIKYEWTDGEIAYEWMRISPLMPVATWKESNGGSLTLIQGGTAAGIASVSNNSLQVFPNPAKDGARVELSAHAATGVCLLHDATGRLVQTVAIRQGKGQIQRLDLPAGLYFYEVRVSGSVVGHGKLSFE